MRKGDIYTVVSPFLGAGNKLLSFGNEVKESALIQGTLQSRLDSGHIKLKEVKAESVEEKPSKKAFFNKSNK